MDNLVAFQQTAVFFRCYLNSLAFQFEGKELLANGMRHTSNSTRACTRKKKVCWQRWEYQIRLFTHFT